MHQYSFWYIGWSVILTQCNIFLQMYWLTCYSYPLHHIPFDILDDLLFLPSASYSFWYISWTVIHTKCIIFLLILVALLFLLTLVDLLFLPSASYSHWYIGCQVNPNHCIIYQLILVALFFLLSYSFIYIGWSVIPTPSASYSYWYWLLSYSYRYWYSRPVHHIPSDILIDLLFLPSASYFYWYRLSCCYCPVHQIPTDIGCHDILAQCTDVLAMYSVPAQ